MANLKSLPGISANFTSIALPRTPWTDEMVSAFKWGFGLGFLMGVATYAILTWMYL